MAKGDGRDAKAGEGDRRRLVSQQLPGLGYWDWDVVRDELYWSDEYFRICGLEPGQISPSYENFLSLVHPDDQEEWKQAWIEASSHHRCSVHYRIITPGGEVRYVHGQAEMQWDDRGEPARIIGTLQDLTDRKRLEYALQTVVHVTPSTAFELSEYYRVCAKSLAYVYNTRFAFVGLFSDDSRETITTQAIWADGEFLDNFEYRLEGTPCADILDLKKELIPKNAAELYPEDTILKEMGVESYFGAPMISMSGEMLGLISVFDVKPMTITSWAESILGLFAQRIACYIEHHNIEEKVKTSEKELRHIFRDMQDTYFRTNTEGNILRVSESVRHTIGYQVDELLGVDIRSLYTDPEQRLELIELLDQEGGAIQNFHAVLNHKDGSPVWVSVNAHYYRDAKNNILGIEGMTRNISRHREAELQMKKMSSALEQSADLVMITDNKGIVEYVNPAFEETTGYGFSEVVGGSSNVMLSGEQSPDYYKRLWETLLSGEVYHDVMINRKKNGDLYYEDKLITPIFNEKGEIIHFVSTGRDITERMKNEERLRFMAHHDALTKLPNRILFMDRLEHSLALAKRHTRKVAVLFLDLDRFKTINDTLGHDVGDQMLIQLSERLVGSLRESDTVARLGGDEFAVLLNDIETEQDISQLAHKILRGLEQPIEVGERELFITTSIGISMFPSDGSESVSLLKHADVAMYRAKELGKNNYQFYSVDMGSRALQRLTMENSLRRALERGEFRLLYQPQINIETGKITGAEALLRWQHPDLGMVSPHDFIPILEETGLISSVGYWVFSTACQQIQAWHEMGFQSLTMSVNISGCQFYAKDFIENIASFVREHHVSPDRLELEITESTLMKNEQSTTLALTALTEMGFSIALDDFGTGYSSLSYLRRFNIDVLKVDQVFIRDVVENEDDAAITSAIIAMAQSLRLKVVAEGVETQEQLEFLKEHHCSCVQGYLFHRPLPADKMTQLLLTEREAVVLKPEDVSLYGLSQ